MKKKFKIQKTTMFVFGLYKRDKCSLDVPIGTSVGDVKKLFQAKFNIYIDELNKKAKTILVLQYGGADLDDTWCFTNLGIPAGSTIRIIVKEVVQPVLYIFCTYNEETVEITDKNLNVPLLKVEELRTICAQTLGLPISVFRLVFGERELFDGYQLFDYGAEAGNTIRLENWDGWNEFIHLCIMGHTPNVLAQISTDEVMSRFQMKVALFIASHFGHVDLARSLLKQGIRADEPIGVHPLRQWIRTSSHVETKKCPIHEATEQGQLGVVRLMVNHDITSVMAKDGNDLTPLNIALRKKIKQCASFLLSHQWSKVPVGKLGSITVQTLRKVKEWCNTAKEKCFAKYGSTRSSLKRKSFNVGSLVSFGLPVVNRVHVTESPMTGKPQVEMKENNRKKSIAVFQEINELNKEDPEHYFKQMAAVTNYKNIKLEKHTKWGNVLDVTDMGTRFLTGVTSNLDETNEQKSQKKPASILTKLSLSGQKSSDSESTTNNSNASVVSRMRRHTFSSVSEDDEETTKPLKAGLLGKLKEVPESDQSDKINEHTMKTPSKPAFKSKLLSTKEQNAEKTDDTSFKIEQTGKRTSELKGNVLKLPAILKRKDTIPKIEDPRNTENQTNVKENKSSGDKNPKNLLQSSKKIGKTVSSFDLDKSKTTKTTVESLSPTQIEKSASSTTLDQKTTKRKRRRSTLSISPTKDGAVPLPNVSTENINRPFFYWNGLREEDYVTPFLDQVTKYKGTNSRDRAFRSLTIANTFKEKPWLAQVRMAMSLTSLSLKRTMTEILED